MIEVADILRLHGPAYRQQHRLLPSQQKVLEDLVRCRTAACGGRLYRCDHCGQEHYSYHSCRNRHCPKCHAQQTERWLAVHQRRLLACDYYLLTFTLPQELRALTYANQKALYSLLMSSATAALQRLGWDPNYVGGQMAILAVLHTWTRRGLDPMRFARSAVGAGIACSAPVAFPETANAGCLPAIPLSWFPATP